MLSMLEMLSVIDVTHTILETSPMDDDPGPAAVYYLYSNAAKTGF